MGYINAGDVKPKLTNGSEIAFIDVREHGQYGEGHPFFVVSIPYSQLELKVDDLLPNKSIDIVLLDEACGTAEKAKMRLEEIGYSSISILNGGAQAWAAAGYTLYKGVNLPSKTMGEMVEHGADTPRVTAEQLKKMQENNDNFVLLDGRTPEEFCTMNISGAVCCPNAELGHRLPHLVFSEETKIVVNCAGRTRSIIGAQGLINQGFSNPIFALENGTQGWELAGYELTRGAADNLPHQLDQDTLEKSRIRAEELKNKFGLNTIDIATLKNWQIEAERTTYVFDIRTRQEFEAGHLPGSVHAPGGQLVQATDKKIAARGARIVLIDDTGLRAANTAIWLSQMKHEVYLLSEDISQIDDLASGGEALKTVNEKLALCLESQLIEKLDNGALLLDFNAGMDFRKGHIAEAQWAIRPLLDKLEAVKTSDIILTSSNRNVAELAAIDLREMGFKHLSYLEGDIHSWRVAGIEISTTLDMPSDEDCIDYLFFVHDRHQGNLEAARGYLAWEIGLLDQLDEQERSFYQSTF